MSQAAGQPPAGPFAASGPIPDIVELLPHKPPMVLLDSVVSHDPQATTCRVRIGEGSAFADERGNVPNVVALEYMAQAVGAHSGLCRRAAGEPIRLGFLLGSRKLQLHARCFVPGQDLEVRVRNVWSDGELASFDCEVVDAASGALLASGVLNAYSPNDPGKLTGARLP